jgi:redox-regulated HSP33 family molecular chaperone
VIAQFDPVERAHMANDGTITVDCEFCSRSFAIKLSDLES